MNETIIDQKPRHNFMHFWFRMLLCEFPQHSHHLHGFPYRFATAGRWRGRRRFRRLQRFRRFRLVAWRGRGIHETRREGGYLITGVFWKRKEVGKFGIVTSVSRSILLTCGCMMIYIIYVYIYIYDICIWKIYAHVCLKAYIYIYTWWLHVSMYCRDANKCVCTVICK